MSATTNPPTRPVWRLGGFFVKSIRPDHQAPLAGPPTRPRLGHIIVRFIVLLGIAVALLILAWHR